MRTFDTENHAQNALDNGKHATRRAREINSEAEHDDTQHFDVPVRRLGMLESRRHVVVTEQVSIVTVTGISQIRRIATAAAVAVVRVGSVAAAAVASAAAAAPARFVITAVLLLPLLSP